MPAEPGTKRAVVFVDGQNLFYAVKQAFGYSFPNYDVPALARSLCDRQGWALSGIHFYTGIPSAQDDPFWNRFWSAKLGVMGTRGVVTYSRQLRYRNQTVALPGGSSTTVLVGQEKGVDVRLALDVVRLAREAAFDVALLLSQDQDLSEVADEVRQISIGQRRWIKVASAYPASPTYANRRGVNRTDWLSFDRSFYDACIDRTDYRQGGTP
ncbi:MAG: NYN domain-containing protein [Thermoanaerobaculia bacterium]|nr:NYN domain-containing protein [Thermoanaerobaculia bacterium]